MNNSQKTTRTVYLLSYQKISQANLDLRMSRASETMHLSSESLRRDLFQISFKQLLCELKKAYKKLKVTAERISKCYYFLPCWL